VTVVPIPTVRLAVLVAIGSVLVAALSLDATIGLLVVNGALLVVVAVDLALADAPATIAIERGLPGVLALGSEAEVTWQVANPGGRVVDVSFADQLSPSLRPATRRMTMRVPAHGHRSGSTTIRPARRGRFEIDELTVRVRGPLGLVARQATRRQPSLLRVYPPFRSRDEAELRIQKGRIIEVGLRSAKGRGSGTDFDQLREYNVDDESRRIDWAATARAGKAIVRTYRAERNQTVVNLLDNGRVMAGRVADVPRVEHAMDAVMMLTAVATHLGDRTGLVLFDRAVRAVVPPRHTRDQLGRITEAMYDVPPALVESDYGGAFTETLARFRRRTMLVLYTDLVEEAMAESLFPALPLILRHHLVVVAAIQDPDVVRWAGSAPEDATAAYRQAAAIAELDKRRRTTARLRGLGVTVVDAPPGRLAPRLADAYLHAKATGTL
jgi:uncharacterized protein (DUF58 family)